MRISSINASESTCSTIANESAVVDRSLEAILNESKSNIVTSFRLTSSISNCPWVAEVSTNSNLKLDIVAVGPDANSTAIECVPTPSVAQSAAATRVTSLSAKRLPSIFNNEFPSGNVVIVREKTNL